jgi:hypothetical protein
MWLAADGAEPAGCGWSRTVKRDQHVAPNPKGGWSVRSSGAARASRVFSDQGEAVRHGRDIAKREKTELFIHGRDGTVRERDSYANDPDPPRSGS